jgi:hypothetical protein
VLGNEDAVTIKDADRDRFGIEPRYQWDDGGISLGIAYIRDKSWDLEINVEDITLNYPDWRTFSPKKAWQLNINPAFVQNWGPFSIHFEGAVAFGKATYRSIDRIANEFVEQDFKINGLGLYLDAAYNYGAGDITLMSWYADGTSYNDLNKDTPTLHSAVSMGNFYPFLVAYNSLALGAGYESNLLTDGYSGISGNDQLIGVRNDGGTDLNFANTNHWAVAIMGNHAFTDDISINYGIGYFRLVSLPPFALAANGDVIHSPNTSKSLGVEIDLGATFQILDNLSFSSKFGYMFNGSAYKVVTWDDVNKVGVVGGKPKDTFA